MGICVDGGYHTGTKRPALFIVSVVILAAFSFAVSILPETASAKTHFVGGSGPGNFTTIGDGILGSSPGDIVFVFAGTYFEHPVVNKPLTLLGEDRETTIIDGGGTGDTVRIESQWVNMTRFTIINGSGSIGGASVRLSNARYCHLSNNTLANSFMGLHLHSSSDNIISNNTMLSNIHGMRMEYSDRNTITNNSILLNSIAGIDVVISSSDNVFTYNTVQSNGWSGFRIGSGSSNTISYNSFENNRYGVRIYNIVGTVFSHNLILSNRHNGVYIQAFSDGTKFHHNNIIDNPNQVYYEWNVSIIWDDGYPSGGNYWSDYFGIDQKSGANQDQPGNDGIGDTSHPVDSYGLDRYPLINSTVRPPCRLPTVLDATLSGGDLENLTLTWTLSPDDGEGFHLVTRYHIYRNSTYSSEGAGYQLLASLPNGTSELVDGWVGEGDSKSYFYLVCAVDSYNGKACSQYQAGKFVRSLLRGENLMSVPLIQSDTGILSALQTVSFDKAWSYDPIGQEWNSYVKSKPFIGNLVDVYHTIAFWTSVTEDFDNLTVTGLVPLSTTIQLYAGWNLIAFPSFNTTYTVGDLKMETGATRVEGYDSLAPYHLRILGDMEVLQAGYGYWVWVDTAASLVLYP